MKVEKFTAIFIGVSKNSVRLIPYIERDGIETMSDIEKYYYQVYPGAEDKSFSNKFMDTLNFFYEFVPKEYIGEIYFPSQNDWKPPEIGQIWYPIWFQGGPKSKCGSTSARNLYPPNNWLNYENKFGFQDNTLLETLHTVDDNPYYTVFGLWTYYTKGSGVWINLGKTVKSVNKIHALYLLGLDVNDIAGLIMSSSFMINNSPLELTVSDLVKRIYPSIKDLKNSCIALVREILEFTENGGNKVLEGDELERMYLIDRVNNSADWDGYITMLARSKGYQTVQFTVQANGNGGWAHEIVYVGVTPLVKARESEWHSWSQLKPKIRIADPHDLCYNKECTFTPGKVSRVVCDSQGISDISNCSKPDKYK
jgi:hypothetical protein